MKRFVPVRIGQKAVSFLFDKLTFLRVTLALLVAAGIFFISLGLGEVWVSPLDIAKVLFGGGEPFHQLIIRDFRLPRILIALLVGVALAVAGALLQGMVRNPLASPDIIGISGGASVFVVGFLVLFSDSNGALTISIQWLPVAAFLGALLAAILVYSFSWKNGLSPVRLVLIGIGLSMFMNACTTLLMLVGPIYRASQANIWITGSVNGSTWGQVWILFPWVLVLFIISLMMARHVNLLELGDDVTKAMGSPISKQRIVILLLSTGLVGGSVAFAGGIGFVGLMAPHLARKLIGSSYGALIPMSAIIGAALVMLADLIGRLIAAPLEVPAGVFTAAIGAPYFIYLLFKERSKKS
ncbi:FecCD family ABC transporter permease [Jeotgalibacillus proteolyticus]|uniref:Iron ABC transporter permease n=1 Tax=Jeotgalibacillus proteolyticus TaxID=2082395 RepID=A0A2S5GC54_9BACL|nr:iron ABC transporter permease [Jeotgalibacillus proteolyticus]PPA70612.1 iron ABC transporter permease [Jeotgalibacillus proteolyticus]